MSTCTRCGNRNPEPARFCNACGAALGVSAAAPREERKVVSVLFADLAGFFGSVGASRYLRECEAVLQLT